MLVLAVIVFAHLAKTGEFEALAEYMWHPTKPEKRVKVLISVKNVRHMNTCCTIWLQFNQISEFTGAKLVWFEIVSLNHFIYDVAYS